MISSKQKKVARQLARDGDNHASIAKTLGLTVGEVRDFLRDDKAPPVKAKSAKPTDTAEALKRAQYNSYREYQDRLGVIVPPYGSRRSPGLSQWEFFGSAGAVLLAGQRSKQRVGM